MVPLKKTRPDAFIPTKANSGDAGYDLYSLENKTLLPNERHLFKTGIALAIPEGYYGRIAPRSGLAYKQGVDVMAGVVDSSYRNEIGVLLINLSNEVVQINKGHRIAQIIFECCANADFLEIEEFVEKTERDLSGYGASGK